MKNFDNVPVEPDTRIINEHEVVIDGLPVLIQQWAWDGFVAESIIFDNDDVADLDDVGLFEFVKSNYQIGDDERHTITRSQSGYTFVNVNFTDFEDMIIG